MKKNILGKFGKKYGWVIIGLIVVLVFTFWKSYILHYTLSCTNLMYTMKPWDSLNVDTMGPLLSDNADSVLPSVYSLFHGDGVSLWNPDIGIGDEQEIYILLFPLYYFYKLPFNWAILITTIAKFSLAFLSMFVFLNSYRLNKIACMVGSICYMFSSTMVVWLFWPHTYVICIAPFAFWMLKRLVSDLCMINVLWLSIIIALMLVAGMPTYAAYFMYLLGAWLIFLSIRNYKNDRKKITKLWLYFILAVVIGALLSLPYTMELVESVGNNGYSTSRQNYSSVTLSLDYVRTMVFPYLRDGLNRHINESTVYTGIFSIIMIPFAFLYQKDKKNCHNIFWIIMWCLIMILIFSHILDWFYSKLPLVNTSLKIRLIVLENFVTCILTAIGFDHIITKKEMYKKFIVRLALALTSSLVFIIYQITKVGSDNISIIRSTIIMTGIYYFLILSIIFVTKRLIATAFALSITIINGITVSQFAQEYLPWIEGDAEVIPDSTDTIKFLTENTENEERYLAIGTWTLFPNTNIYYDLNTILAHGFVNTNYDIQKYLKIIDPDIYVTATKTATSKLENNSLLKYAGVKYIVDSEREYFVVSGETSPIGYLTEGMMVKQRFAVESNSFYGINIMCATYGKKLSSEYNVYYQLIDLDNDNIVTEGTTSCDKIKDNSALKLRFEQVDKAEGKQYELRIWTDITDPNETFTLWKVDDNLFSGSLTINEEGESGGLNLSYVSSDNVNELYGDMVYGGNDGMATYEQEEYSPKAFLSEKTEIEDNEESVLEEMAKEYIPNKVFFSKEQNNDLQEVKNTPLNDDEYVKIDNYSNDSIKMEVSTNESRYLVLTDYYTDEWTAYIDGKETDVLKANYLFRSICIDEPGKHTIEFRYEPKRLYIYLGISGVTLCGVTISLLICYIRKMNNNTHTGGKK